MEKKKNIPASLQFDGYEEQKAEFMARYPDAPESSPIEVLNLVLRREFAEQIIRGEKKAEIRDYTPHYYNRLWDKKVVAWADAKADELEKNGASNEEIDNFVNDAIDFLSPIRIVKKIHFHNYNNSWFLDVSVIDNYQIVLVRDQVETLHELYDCHEFDELLEELEKEKAKDRPTFYYFILGDVIDTNITIYQGF